MIKLQLQLQLELTLFVTFLSLRYDSPMNRKEFVIFQKSFYRRRTSCWRSRIERSVQIGVGRSEAERANTGDPRSGLSSLFCQPRSAFNKRAPRPAVALCYQRWDKGRTWKRQGREKRRKSAREKEEREKAEWITAEKNGGAFDDELFTALCSGVQAFTSISGFLLFHHSWSATFSFFFARSFSPFIHSTPLKPSSPSSHPHRLLSLSSPPPPLLSLRSSFSIVRPAVSSFSFVASWFYLFLHRGILFQLRATRTYHTYHQRRSNFFYEMKFEAVPSRSSLLGQRTTRYFRLSFRFQNLRFTVLPSSTAKLSSTRCKDARCVHEQKIRSAILWNSLRRFLFLFLYVNLQVEKCLFLFFTPPQESPLVIRIIKYVSRSVKIKFEL